MKVEIGSKYEGLPWDRPSLRQLPHDWVLEESKPQPRLHRGDALILGLCLLLALVGILQSVYAMVMK